MNFRRQMQAWLAGWQALRVFGMSFETPPHLTPYECPSLVGGMAGVGESNRVLVNPRLTFPKPPPDSLKDLDGCSRTQQWRHKLFFEPATKQTNNNTTDKL